MTGRFEAHAERAQITKDIDNEYEAAPLTRCRGPEQRQAGGKNKREEKARRKSSKRKARERTTGFDRAPQESQKNTVHGGSMNDQLTRERNRRQCDARRSPLPRQWLAAALHQLAGGLRTYADVVAAARLYFHSFRYADFVSPSVAPVRVHARTTTTTG
jgi:hypothetical protein